MHDYLIYFLFAAFFLGLELVYFTIAKRYNIIDRPNERSSHKGSTVRGGGIIFPFSILMYGMYKGFEYPYFVTGLILISCVSFWDDLSSVSNEFRLAIHLTAVSLLFLQSDIFNHALWLIIISFILIIGTINAYNFMDGINGITALYSLSVIGSLYFINEFISTFIEKEYFIAIIASIIVFSIFNVRERAKCFAGDVGSVSLAFIIAFFIIKLMVHTQTVLWILLLSIYGIETVSTIIFRIIRKENIFNAHRSHFFQFLVTQMHFNHITISSVYALLQLMVNCIIIFSFVHNIFVISLLSFLILLIVYLTSRFKLEGRNKLMTKY